MQIEHIAMYVQDLDRARDFFIRYFHAVSNELYQNRTTGFCSYFLSFEGGARLELMQAPVMIDREKSRNRTGFSHLAFRLESKRAVDLLTVRLKQDGYTVVSGPRATGDGYYESCILDAEGNQIEITT